MDQRITEVRERGKLLKHRAAALRQTAYKESCARNKTRKRQDYGRILRQRLWLTWVAAALTASELIDQKARKYAYAILQKLMVPFIHRYRRKKISEYVTKSWSEVCANAPTLAAFNLSPILYHVPDPALRIAISHMKREIHVEGSFIAHEGSVATKLFFLGQGKVQVVPQGGECFVLDEGAFFGEESLLQHEDINTTPAIPKKRLFKSTPEEDKMRLITSAAIGGNKARLQMKKHSSISLSPITPTSAPVSPLSPRGMTYSVSYKAVETSCIWTLGESDLKSVLSELSSVERKKMEAACINLSKSAKLGVEHLRLTDLQNTTPRLFAKLPSSFLCVLLARCTQHSLPCGAELSRIGAPITSLLLITKGSVSCTEAERGFRRHSAPFKPPCLIGAEGMGACRVHVRTVVAESPCVVWVLEREVVLDLCVSMQVGEGGQAEYSSAVLEALQKNSLAALVAMLAPCVSFANYRAPRCDRPTPSFANPEPPMEPEKPRKETFLFSQFFPQKVWPTIFPSCQYSCHATSECVLKAGSSTNSVFLLLHGKLTVFTQDNHPCRVISGATFLNPAEALLGFAVPVTFTVRSRFAIICRVAKSCLIQTGAPYCAAFEYALREYEAHSQGQTVERLHATLRILWRNATPSRSVTGAPVRSGTPSVDPTEERSARSSQQGLRRERGGPSGVPDVRHREEEKDVAETQEQAVRRILALLSKEATAVLMAGDRGGGGEPEAATLEDIARHSADTGVTLFPQCAPPVATALASHNYFYRLLGSNVRRLQLLPSSPAPPRAEQKRILDGDLVIARSMLARKPARSSTQQDRRIAATSPLDSFDSESSEGGEPFAVPEDPPPLLEYLAPTTPLRAPVCTATGYKLQAMLGPVCDAFGAADADTQMSPTRRDSLRSVGTPGSPVWNRTFEKAGFEPSPPNKPAKPLYEAIEGDLPYLSSVLKRRAAERGRAGGDGGSKADSKARGNGMPTLSRGKCVPRGDAVWRLLVVPGERERVRRESLMEDAVSLLGKEGGGGGGGGACAGRNTTCLASRLYSSKSRSTNGF